MRQPSSQVAVCPRSPEREERRAAPRPLTQGRRLLGPRHPLGAHCLGSNLALFSNRTLTVRRSCCWLSPPCRSAWSWSWGPPSSCAIRSRELKWLSTPSMPTDSTLWGGGPLSWWYGVWGRCPGLELSFFPGYVRWFIQSPESTRHEGPPSPPSLCQSSMCSKHTPGPQQWPLGGVH